eukprot:NODE_35_length_36362_cov_0.944434.p5 type:complete len:522 gc:universal NODE_35_length_36362_cov_0.944434:18829-20394(+)
MIYSAIYSGVQVYEIRVRNVDVMRRMEDNWVNATQILKVGDIDKPQRTKILEREVQTGRHEKVQGGYGKYQGTWVPFERGVQLAKDYNVYHVMSEILEYIPGESQIQQKRSLPSNPTPKPPKKKKTSNSTAISTTTTRKNNVSNESKSIPTATFTYNVPQPKDYRDLLIKSLLESSMGTPPFLLKLPLDLDLQMNLDAQGHSALHWACALARVDIVRHLLKIGKERNVNLKHHLNVFGQSPLMRAIMYADNYEEKRFPELLEMFKDSIFSIDYMNRTILHHIAIVSGDEGKQAACNYYLKCIFELPIQGKEKLLDFVDLDGLTALQLAFIKKNNNLAKILMNSGAKPPSISTRPLAQPADPNSLTYLENLNSSYSSQISLSLKEARELKSQLDSLQSVAGDYLNQYERVKAMNNDLSKLKDREETLKKTLKKLKVDMFDLDIKNYVRKHPNLEIPSDNLDLRNFASEYVLSSQKPEVLSQMAKNLPKLKEYVEKQQFPKAMLDEWVNTVADGHKDEIIREG